MRASAEGGTADREPATDARTPQVRVVIPVPPPDRLLAFARMVARTLVDEEWQAEALAGRPPEELAHRVNNREGMDV